MLIESGDKLPSTRAPFGPELKSPHICGKRGVMAEAAMEEKHALHWINFIEHLSVREPLILTSESSLRTRIVDGGQHRKKEIA
jgi:hypothetical protein